jgi:hypothetical protein
MEEAEKEMTRMGKKKGLNRLKCWEEFISTIPDGSIVRIASYNTPIRWITNYECGNCQSVLDSKVVKLANNICPACGRENSLVAIIGHEYIYERTK